MRFGWTPLMNQLRDEMDRLFSDIDPRTSSPGFAQSYPPLNVWEDDNNLYVEAELPGMQLDRLDIFIAEGNQLSIKGERQPVEAAGNWHRRERGYGKFHRQLALPVAVDSDKVEARFEQGVLHLTLPKSPKAKPRKIEVKGE
jgi:HSP20 family protein